jgi:hypothetical protein
VRLCGEPVEKYKITFSAEYSTSKMLNSTVYLSVPFAGSGSGSESVTRGYGFGSGSEPGLEPYQKSSNKLAI